MKCNSFYSFEIKNKENNYLNCYDSLDSNFIKYLEDSNYTAEEINEKIYEQIIYYIKNFEITEGKEKIIEGKDNYSFHLTTLQNEIDSLEGKNNDSNKFSKIDLGECENILREKNHIDKNDSLLILKYEKLNNEISRSNLQYEIYELFNKKRLNLSVCKEVPINIYVPKVLSEQLHNLYNELKDLGYDLFDINSHFYQDICTPYKSTNGTDVILSDRINYYYNNEETQCQPNCQFSNYSFESQYLKCECDIQYSEINFDNNNNNIGAKSIYKSFYDVLKFSNYKVLKCYKLAFSLTIFKNKNKGNIIVLIYFGIYYIFLLIYFIKGISELKNDLLKNIINNESKDINSGKNESKEGIKSIVDLINTDLKKNKNNNIDNNNIIITKKRNNKRLILRKDLKKRRTQQRIIFDFPPKKILYIQNNIKIFNNEFINSDKINKSNSKNVILDSNGEKNEMNKIYKFIVPTTNEEKLDSYELNNLEYNEAINQDKRNFMEIYWSLLKREHLIIFTFFIRNDHNIIYIKYSRFIFSICTDMALNVFFFADETMHKMFLDYGKYNFIQQIPQIIYSTIVSQLIELLLCYLSLTDKFYYQIKSLNIKSLNLILRQIRCIELKINYFYIFIGIMFLFYWYLITCFCAVYENTQIAFIKDSLLSFALGLLYPFVLYLLPSALRKISLKCCKGKLSFIYKLSDIIPFF